MTEVMIFIAAVILGITMPLLLFAFICGVMTIFEIIDNKFE